MGVYIDGHCMIGKCSIGDHALIGSNVDIRRLHPLTRILHLHNADLRDGRMGFPRHFVSFTCHEAGLHQGGVSS